MKIDGTLLLTKNFVHRDNSHDTLINTGELRGRFRE